VCNRRTINVVPERLYQAMIATAAQIVLAAGHYWLIGAATNSARPDRRPAR